MQEDSDDEVLIFEESGAEMGSRDATPAYGASYRSIFVRSTNAHACDE